MSITLIAAMNHTRVIADSQKPGMLWRNKAELEHFKRETLGKKCIVGLKTALNMPILTGREIYVMIDGMTLEQSELMATYPENYNFMLSEKPSSLALIRSFIESDEEVMVIGGAKTYSAFMDAADKAIISVLWNNAVGDVYMPNFTGRWVQTETKAFPEDLYVVHRFAKEKSRPVFER